MLKAGAVLVTTMPLLRTGELQTIHEIAHLDAALVDHRFLDAVEPLGVPTVAFGDDAWVATARGQGPRRSTTSRPPATTSAMLAFTSGTTGRPKATMHFHRDVLSICDTFSRHVLQPSADDVFTGTPPYAFTFGLGGVLLFPLHAGASTLLVEKATPAELADLIDEHGVTVCFTAPTAYKAMLAGGQDGADAAEGGLRRRAPARRRCGRRSATRPASRSSTASARPRCCTSSSRPPGDDIRPGSTGRAVPGYVATVVDDDGQRAAARAAGRLAVKGPTGCRYLDDPPPGGVRPATAGTSPATPSSATTTATSGTRRAATT